MHHQFRSLLDNETAFTVAVVALGMFPVALVVAEVFGR